MLLLSTVKFNQVWKILVQP